MGRFVALSGMDGAGKTTLAQNLLASLKARGLKAVDLAMGPSRAWGWAEALAVNENPQRAFNADALSLALNFERFSFVADHVVPKLRHNDVVVMQRYVLDWIAVGRAFGAGSAEFDLMSAFTRYVDLPAVTVYLDVSPQLAAERIRGRGGADGVRESDEMLDRMSGAYEAVLRDFPVTLRLDAAAPTAEHVSRVLDALSIPDSPLMEESSNLLLSAPRENLAVPRAK